MVLDGSPNRVSLQRQKTDNFLVKYSSCFACDINKTG
jgi:hypothetical protein